MLNNLKFVKGAAQKKSLIPVLSHFEIKQNRITGSDGLITMSAPCELDIEATPQAVAFVKAINACKVDPVEMTMTKAGRLKIVSGRFTDYVPCTDEVFPDLQPKGEVMKFNGDFLSELKLLKPFIGTNATQPWSSGILLKGSSMFVTNNVILIEYKGDTEFSPVPVNIPAKAVDEMIRIGEMPESFQLDERSISLNYSDGKWIRTSLLAIEWPPVEQLLDIPMVARYETDPQFYEDVAELTPFADEERRLFISPSFLGTAAIAEEGARIEADRALTSALVNIDQIGKLCDIATAFDFSSYPKACPFVGENIRGIIVGIRFNG